MTAHQKSQTLKYTLYTKNVLPPDEAELYELCQFAGITLDPQVFRIVMDLLRLKVAPTAIERMLKSMTTSKLKRQHAPDGTESAPLPSSRGRHPSAGTIHSTT